jgi:hypothetical protein
MIHHQEIHMHAVQVFSACLFELRPCRNAACFVGCHRLNPGFLASFIYANESLNTCHR